MWMVDVVSLELSSVCIAHVTNTEHSFSMNTAPTFLEPTVWWQDIFGNDHPVEVEIGPGKGGFLLAHAQNTPERNFFAVEICKRRAFRLAHLVERDGPSNIRAVHADMRCLIRTPLWPSGVSVYHLYFPDPWWKRRHHERRLFHEDFAMVLAQTLVPGGKILLASDVREYFIRIVQQFNTVPELRQFPWERDHVTKKGKPILTDFERKFREREQPIYYAGFRKKDGEVYPDLRAL
jgi:tRNA (guanine-N7-)-methyltransferase